MRVLSTFVSPIVATALALLLGCGAATPTESFRHPDGGGIKRASFELQCPEDQLEVTDLGSWTLGVTGCGKRTVYKMVYGAGWVNNGAGEEPTNTSGAPRPHPTGQESHPGNAKAKR